MSREDGRGVGRRRHRLIGHVAVTGAFTICLFSAFASAGGPAKEDAPGNGGQAAEAVVAPGWTGVTLQKDRQALEQTRLRLTIPWNREAGAALSRRSLSQLPASADGTAMRLVALPDCRDAHVSSVILRLDGFEHIARDAEASSIARVQEIVRIRDQSIAVVIIDRDAALAASDRAGLTRSGLAGIGPIDIEIGIDLAAATGPIAKNTGPFTFACEEAILNYGVSLAEAPPWRPPGAPDEGARNGTATYCYSVADCAGDGIDILFFAAESLAADPEILALAQHHASYFGLNVGIVSAAVLAELTAEELHGFIQDVYETTSAEHFGDGHLGFVLLIGDAYADDNATVMIPVYNGYGGIEKASDHYYACVAGDDDYEDVMLGRLSVGNATEVATVVGKSLNYMPLSDPPAWHERVLLVGGLFYSQKEQYVTLFDRYEEIIPDEFTVDRIYRHDFGSDAACAQSLVDSINGEGYLIVNFAGDGWISSWHHTMTTSHIPLMANPVRLPIVLSMACNTGWLDNTTEQDPTGSYDCLAEQLVNTADKGAIACLAAPRASDGAIFRTLTEKIYHAAFQERCVFIGETMAVSKLLHLQDGGGEEYTRQFNLFGDPTLLYRWDVPPSLAPDLAVKPFSCEWSSDLPSAYEDLDITIPIWNQSPVSVGPVLVRVTDTYEGGTDIYEAVIPWLTGWAKDPVDITIPTPPAGPHVIEIAVDPDDEILETDEYNNSFAPDVYVYSYLPGFPVDLPVDAFGSCTAYLDGERRIVVAGEDSRVIVLSPDGSIAWQSTPTIAPILYGPEIAPAVGDIDGDGDNEIVAIRRSGVQAFEADGESLWSVNTDEPVGSPVLADLDGDGDLDAVVASRAVFGSSSKIVAIDDGGTQIWSYSLPSTNGKATSQPVAGDFDLDGHADIAYGTEDGYVCALSCAQSPPVVLWGPVLVASDDVKALAAGDLDGDGYLELIVGMNELFVLNAEDGSAHWNVPLGADVRSLAVADVDGDLDLEVLAGTVSPGTFHLVDGGTEIWGVPLSGEPGSSSAIADIDGDGDIEILVGTDAGFLHLLSADGSDFISPIPLTGGLGTPFIADHTGEGRPEVSLSTADGKVFAFGLTEDPAPCHPEWRGHGGNAAHAGIYAQPLHGEFADDLLLDGRYIVTGDVQLGAGTLVTVAPEALIEFDGTAAHVMTVEGSLEAVGAPGREIVVKAAGCESRSGWQGIDVRPGASATFSSCRFSGASSAIMGSQGSLVVEGCEFSDNTYGGYLRFCTLDMSGTTFTASDSTGMFLNGGSGNVAGCSFNGNFRSGVTCDRGASHTFVGCDFSYTAAGNGLVLLGHSPATVDSCSFTWNADNGALVSQSSPLFTHCAFTDNEGAGIRSVAYAEPQVGWTLCTRNWVGVYSAGGAVPILGYRQYPATGMNSIYENDWVAVANYSGLGYAINALDCWWGEPGTGVLLFYGPVVYLPQLNEPPFESSGKETAADGDLSPTAFRLEQNVPNPFNPTTVLRYEVPAPGGDLELLVYDAAGRRVATLHAGHRDPGAYQAAWNGRNDHGQRVASGVYFARMVAPDFSATRKMILLK